MNSNYHPLRRKDSNTHQTPRKSFEYPQKFVGRGRQVTNFIHLSVPTSDELLGNSFPVYLYNGKRATALKWYSPLFMFSLVYSSRIYLKLIDMGVVQYPLRIHVSFTTFTLLTWGRRLLVLRSKVKITVSPKQRERFLLACLRTHRLSLITRLQIYQFSSGTWLRTHRLFFDNFTSNSSTLFDNLTSNSPIFTRLRPYPRLFICLRPSLSQHFNFRVKTWVLRYSFNLMSYLGFTLI